MRLEKLLVCAAFVLAACGGGGDDPDARPTYDGAPQPDAADLPDGAGNPDAPNFDADLPDAGLPDAQPTPSELIQAARDTADGTGLLLPIESAMVTYLKPALGNDPAGFTIQAEQAGPALFVTVDPATLTPPAAVGDVVNFTITTMGTLNGGIRIATAIADWVQVSTGGDVSPLAQDLGAEAILVSNIDNFESEIGNVTDATVVAAFGFAGTGFVQAQIDTTAITSDTNLRVRMPATLQTSLELVPGCVFNLTEVPVGRFVAAVQLPAYVAADISVTSCPAPRLTNAVALTATSVQLTFDRNIAVGSVLADGTQFTIDNNLTVSAASVSGKTVTLTTSTQVTGQSYTVTVAGTVQDLMGAGIDPAFDTFTFAGFTTLAVVRINEVNANIGTNPDTCDLIELRVVSGGTMAGYLLRERNSGSLMTFPAGFIVAANDIIVVHMGGASAVCNPNTATQETTAKDQQPQVSFAGNYDTAFDFWSTDAGLTGTDNVFTLYNNSSTIIDAVFVSDAPTGTAAADSETQAATVAAANQWQMNGGGIPTGGFIDDNFNAHAALDLDGTGTTAAGTSIQRLDNTDDNEKADWNTDTITVQAQTWGLINAGQTPF